MKKRTLILTLILAGALFVSLVSSSEALKPYRREVNVNYNNNGSGSYITLSWVYNSGDTLHKTWDGKTWEQLSLGSTTPGQLVTVTDAAYVPYYGNIYFELREPGYGTANRTNIDNSTMPLFTTIPAYPPLKNAHSDLAANTEYCAGCHVTHAAEGPYLMKAPNRTALCFTCHGGAGTGSRYNVEKGIVALKNGTYAKALGGAFVGGRPEWDNRTTTSTHIYSYSEQGYAPGYSDPGKVWNDVDCNDCHSSHADRSSYRMLKSDDPSNYGNVYAWAYNQNGLGETVWYENVSNISCNYCHIKFKGFGGSGSARDATPYPVLGVNHYVYRHNTQNVDISSYDGGLTTDLPLESPDGSAKKLMCLTCHYPHGTTALGSDLSAFDRPVFDGVYDHYTTALKRLDYYGVCQNCHKK